MLTSPDLDQDIRRELRETAQQLRVDSVRASAAASSGHPTSSMSAADLMAVLLARHLRYDFTDPKAPGKPLRRPGRDPGEDEERPRRGRRRRQGRRARQAASRRR
jgi:hypothetical protein